MHFSSFDELVPSSRGFNRESKVSLAALFAGFIFVGVMLLRCVSLFFWPTAAEYSRSSSSSGSQTFRSYRLLPANYWETAKVIGKTNLILFLLLLPFAVMFSFTPVWQMVVQELGHGYAFGLKGLLIFWCGSMLVFTFGLTPSIRDGWQYWRPFLTKAVVLIMLYVLGLGLVTAPSALPFLSFGGLFVLLTIGWFFYCGARYGAGHSKA